MNSGKRGDLKKAGDACFAKMDKIVRFLLVFCALSMGIISKRFFLCRVEFGAVYFDLRGDCGSASQGQSR